MLSHVSEALWPGSNTQTPKNIPLFGLVILILAQGQDQFLVYDQAGSGCTQIACCCRCLPGSYSRGWTAEQDGANLAFSVQAFPEVQLLPKADFSKSILYLL